MGTPPHCRLLRVFLGARMKTRDVRLSWFYADYFSLYFQ